MSEVRQVIFERKTEGKQRICDTCKKLYSADQNCWRCETGIAAVPTAQTVLTQNDDGLEVFLSGIRSSVRDHAERKGYRDAYGIDVAGEMTKILGTARDHALSEIAYKLVEFKMTPRKVIAEKVAGWAFRLWLNCKE